jgi:hypothetical protein
MLFTIWVTPENRLAKFALRGSSVLSQYFGVPNDVRFGLVKTLSVHVHKPAVKTQGKVHLRSRNNKDFNQKYPTIVKALAGMPDETVVDGEVVALDESGHPSFNALQNAGASKTPLLY